MHRTAIVIALLAAAVGLLPAADKVGVLYIERTFEGSEMVQRVQQGLKSKAEGVGAQVDGINDELKKLQAELESTPQSSPAFLQAKEQFEVLKLRRKLYLERSQEALHGLEVQRLKASYLKIREVLAEFAAAEGYDLVLMAPLPEVRAQGVQQLNLELATHSVLYHSEAMDITEAFTSYLNSKVTSLEDEAADGEGEAEANAPVIDLENGE